jgi:hypothetical protein
MYFVLNCPLRFRCSVIVQRRTERIPDVRSMLQLLVTANVVYSSLILFTLIMEAVRSSETSVLTRATRRLIAEDGILHSRRSENLKSYSECRSILPHMFIFFCFHRIVREGF